MILFKIGRKTYEKIRNFFKGLLIFFLFLLLLLLSMGLDPAQPFRLGWNGTSPIQSGWGDWRPNSLSLSLSLLMDLGLTWSSHLGWAEMVPTHLISELFCRNVNYMQLRSCRLQRKVRGRRRRRELHDIEATTVRRRGWSQVLLLFYVGGVVTMAGAGATWVAEKRVAALATVGKDESC